ncbi:MAG TPA: hypothetical protein VMD59_07175 [Acidimicrobiales bacterium]|nr:hypothetical protein [Acidimicrobiales bacterium]
MARRHGDAASTPTPSTSPQRFATGAPPLVDYSANGTPRASLLTNVSGEVARG